MDAYIAGPSRRDRCNLCKIETKQTIQMNELVLVEGCSVRVEGIEPNGRQTDVTENKFSIFVSIST